MNISFPPNSTSNITVSRQLIVTVPTSSVTLITVIILGVFAVLTFIFNSCIVLAWIKEPQIRTPFNIYIFNMTMADLCIALIVIPMWIWNQLDSIWTYSRIFCGFLRYFSWMGIGTATHAVMLISLDRAWALYGPVHYRDHRSERLSIIVRFLHFIWETLKNLQAENQQNVIAYYCLS